MTANSADSGNTGRDSLCDVRDEYPEKGALKVWKHPVDESIICSVFRTKMGHLCGYARFPKRPVRAEGYEGILRYVPVHGGITYASASDGGTMVYGFDCSHSGDAVSPEYERHPQYRDPGGHVWTEREVERETEGMVVAIKSAADVEEAYLSAGDSEARAAVLDEWHERLREVGVEFDVSDNFGAMIGLMGGLRP